MAGMESLPSLNSPQGRERLNALLETARRDIATRGMLSMASNSEGALADREVEPDVDSTNTMDDEEENNTH